MEVTELSRPAQPLEATEAVPGSVRDAVVKARTSWLKNTEVVDILENWGRYKLRVNSLAPRKPAGGLLFLVNRKECRFFRKDGHNWRKKADNKTIRETHEKLKVGNAEMLNCYYAHADREDGLQRRCYWLLDEAREHIVLVHYLNCSTSRAGGTMPPRQLSGPNLQHAGSAPLGALQRRPSQADLRRAPLHAGAAAAAAAAAAMGRRPEESGGGMRLGHVPAGGGAPPFSPALPVPPHFAAVLPQHSALATLVMQHAAQQGPPAFVQQHPWQWVAQQQYPQHPQQGQLGASGSFNGQFGQHSQQGGLDASGSVSGQFGHGPRGFNLPPRAQSLLHTLSHGPESTPPFSLFPQLSLEVSRLSNMEGSSLAQFLTQLEHSLEQQQQQQHQQQHQQHQQLVAGGQQQQQGAAGGRHSTQYNSLMRLLQLWEASTGHGASAGRGHSGGPWPQPPPSGAPGPQAHSGGGGLGFQPYSGAFRPQPSIPPPEGPAQARGPGQAAENSGRADPQANLQELMRLIMAASQGHSGPGRGDQSPPHSPADRPASPQQQQQQQQAPPAVAAGEGPGAVAPRAAPMDAEQPEAAAAAGEGPAWRGGEAAPGATSGPSLPAQQGPLSDGQQLQLPLPARYGAEAGGGAACAPGRGPCQETAAPRMSEGQPGSPYRQLGDKAEQQRQQQQRRRQEEDAHMPPPPPKLPAQWQQPRPGQLPAEPAAPAEGDAAPASGGVPEAQAEEAVLELIQQLLDLKQEAFQQLGANGRTAGGAAGGAAEGPPAAERPLPTSGTKRKGPEEDSEPALEARGPADGDGGSSEGGASAAFRIYEFSPLWDSVSGGSAMVIAGMERRDAAGLCVRFGEVEVPAIQLLPGVLCCKVPPSQAPGRVPLTVVPAEGPGTGAGAEAGASSGPPAQFEYRVLAEQPAAADAAGGG